MTGGFQISDEQARKVRIWQAEQNELLEAQGKSDYAGAVGGRYTYSFTPTSMGIVTEVSDELTGNMLDLTDYDWW